MDTKNMKKENLFINIMRVVCAYMVVAIHIHPFEDINSSLCYIFTQIIPRIAVPFFFAISGYFYIKTLLNGKSNFKKYFIRLVQPYVFWSCIYFIMQLAIDIKNNNFSIVPFIKNCIVNFFIKGSYYHLWFFPTLFFCVIIVTIFNRINKLKLLAYSSIPLYILGLLGTSYYGVGNKIPLINSIINQHYYTILRRIIFMGLPFFALGYFINLYKNKINELQNKTLYSAFIISLILFISEIYLVNLFGISRDIILTIFLVPMLLVIIMFCFNNGNIESNKNTIKFKLIASFIYFSHPIFIMLYSILITNIGQTLLYILVIITISCFGYLLSKINGNIVKKVL